MISWDVDYNIAFFSFNGRHSSSYPLLILFDSYSISLLELSSTYSIWFLFYFDFLIGISTCKFLRIIDGLLFSSALLLWVKNCLPPDFLRFSLFSFISTWRWFDSQIHTRHESNFGYVNDFFYKKIKF